MTYKAAHLLGQTKRHHQEISLLNFLDQGKVLNNHSKQLLLYDMLCINTFYVSYIFVQQNWACYLKYIYLISVTLLMLHIISEVSNITWLWEIFLQSQPMSHGNDSLSSSLQSFSTLMIILVTWSYCPIVGL